MVMVLMKKGKEFLYKIEYMIINTCKAILNKSSYLPVHDQIILTINNMTSDYHNEHEWSSSEVYNIRALNLILLTNLQRYMSL